ncbi:MAG: 3-deoxy-manno-octulosonate cytidylyltransferase [Xanthomonadales bacterium]|nr:3-deoxy-manno-octulosonate cytidylyltransferase [Xanthomonadales bacterium]
MTKVVIAIPARFQSVRLPGKPLRRLAGRPLIAHVIDRAREAGDLPIIVATDDMRIAEVAETFGVQVCLTDADHPSGSDRLSECARRMNYGKDTILVNLQGDEPLMPAACLMQVAKLLHDHPEAAIATLATPITDANSLFDPNVVKVVCDQQGYALYFSRAPVPWARDAFAKDRQRLPAGLGARRHIGLYAYRVGALHQFTKLPPSTLEQAESLEQLRALENGLKIVVANARAPVPAGVDTEEDLQRVEKLLESGVTLNGVASTVEPVALRPTQRQFKVAFVCMGNICRSPLSEALARSVAKRNGLGDWLEVASRGTHASHQGDPADLRAQGLARRMKLDLRAHRAQRLQTEDFRQFDLLIAHDQANLNQMRALCPPDRRDRLRLLLDFAPELQQREVPDPYNGSDADFARAFGLIDSGIKGLFAWIGRQLEKRGGAPARQGMTHRE